MPHWRAVAEKPLSDLKCNLILDEEAFRASLP
jgi:hypothetical protein